MSLYDRFRGGSVSALSRIITHIENRTDGYRQLLSRLFRDGGKAYRVGLTGPPGAGKSSLVNHLAVLMIERGKKVAVICVDPSSPFSGGALLGDRVRMQDIPIDKGVFIRSMGSRGSTGGLASATFNVSVALSAFGFDTIIIETIGVGQMELDIIDACDTVVVTLVPESGDAIQAMKAGLMEIADLFAVNKSDRDGAEQMAYDLKMALELKTTPSDWEVPIISTQAVKNVNIDELFDKIEAHRKYLSESGELDKKRARQMAKRVEQIVLKSVQSEINSNLLSASELEAVVTRIMAGEDDPYSAGRLLFERYKNG